MTPFGKQLQQHILSAFAPKTQLYASDYGQGPGQPQSTRTIQSEAPVSPAPAPAPAGGSSIVDAVQNAFGPSPTDTLTAGTGDPTQPPAVKADKPPATIPATPDQPAIVPDPPVAATPAPTTPTPDAPNPAPPQPTVADTPQVDYLDMYNSQAERRNAMQAMMRERFGFAPVQLQ